MAESSTDIIAAWEKAQSPLLDTAIKQEQAAAAAIMAAHVGLPPVAPVQKSSPEQVRRASAVISGMEEYDPLTKLIRAEKAIFKRGAKGEHVAEELQDVRNAIRSITEQREAAPIRRQAYERER